MFSKTHVSACFPELLFFGLKMHVVLACFQKSQQTCDFKCFEGGAEANVFEPRPALPVRVVMRSPSPEATNDERRHEGQGK